MPELLDKRGMTEEEAIARYRAKNYPRPALTADIAVFARTGAEWRVLLIRRGNHPYLGCWALPGGFADENEPVERTAARELEEETGLSGLPLALTGFYSAPGRDPRGWVVSAAYAVRLEEQPPAKAGDDAAETAWLPVRFTDGVWRVTLPEGERLAFDHAQVLADAARQCLETGSPV
ncbi:MAG: NUDIX hydrolase [Lachnospiraceae bacterium]|nr:NUDIX hydrolase [Lachnospiraceae bacterium]